MNGRRIYIFPLLLGVILLSSISFSATSVAASFPYSFEGGHFAIIIDLNTDGSDLNVRRDLENGTSWADSIPDDDKDFFLTYMNQSNVDIAYSGLLKYENNFTLGDMYPDYRLLLQYAGKDVELFYINGTAPFQQLVEYFKTPAGEDIFVANNFLGLVAYSANATDQVLDADDEIYMGYTFALSELLAAIDNVLTSFSAPIDLGQFNAVPFFQATAEGWEFGIEYQNLLCLWQLLDVEPNNPLASHLPLTPQFPAGLMYGTGLRAITLFDSLKFTYSVYTTDLGGDLLEISIDSKYDIGETSLLITPETTIDPSEYPSSFISSPSYTLYLPPDVSVIPGLPDNITVNLPDFAFYINDDAQKRIHDETDGFGISVMGATNVFGMDVELPTGFYEDATQSIPIYKQGNTSAPIFQTKFLNKDTYKLLGVDELGYNPADNHNISLELLSPTGWGLPPSTKEYLKFEVGMAHEFTRWVAGQLLPGFDTSTISMYANSSKYVSFIEYPEWSGGQIVHDPTFSAITGVGDSTSSTTISSSTQTSTSTPSSTKPSPGFALMAVLAAGVIVTLLTRRRKK